MEQNYFCYDINIDVPDSFFSEAMLENDFNVTHKKYDTTLSYLTAKLQVVKQYKAKWREQVVAVDYTKGCDINALLKTEIRKKSCWSVVDFRYIRLNSWIQKSSIAVNKDTKVRITDPCYNQSECFRYCELPVSAGEYQCLIKYKYDLWDFRVAELKLQKSNSKGILRKLGYISVDTRLAGFFFNKPDFDGEAWARFCKHIDLTDKNKCWRFPFADMTSDNLTGFFAISHLTGCRKYPVYAHFDETANADIIKISFGD